METETNSYHSSRREAASFKGGKSTREVNCKIYELAEDVDKRLKRVKRGNLASLAYIISTGPTGFIAKLHSANSIADHLLSLMCSSIIEETLVGHKPA